MDLGYNPPSFYWIVFYPDEERPGRFIMFPQYHFITGKQHNWKEVDQSKAVYVGWFPFDDELAWVLASQGINVKRDPRLQPHIMHVLPGRRIIRLSRNFAPIDVSRDGELKPSNVPKRTVYLLGWQMTVEGKNLQSVMYIYEDGSVQLGGKFSNIYDGYSAQEFRWVKEDEEE